MLGRILTELAGSEARQRERAAAELGDLFEAGVLDQDEAELAVAALVDLALAEGAGSVAGESLNSLGKASIHYWPSYSTVSRLITLLPGASVAEIEHILDILASTHDPAAKQIILSYVEHPHVVVRQAAADALEELPGRIPGELYALERYVTPAYARQWQLEVSAALGRPVAVFEQTYGYPCGQQFVDGPASIAELTLLSSGSLRTRMPSELLVWYGQVREVSLPDTANGFFLHPPETLAAHATGEGVTRVAGIFESEVVVFGSDGGGTLYGLGFPAGAPVYRLPPGHLIDGLYTSHDPRFAVIAPHLVGFLDTLRDAVVAFAEAGEIAEL
ncbi:HEAT repeat domain-containing protein [Catelliglobosispora koreensis]|uniref:HEAT repeat domain-containing protein n=1 Tax=Catelliglobosispora koreensis TaxID=129052 RepID=UPI0003753858|nr:hypothetical protein [Catelliglobosispora koreensis]